MNDQREHPSSPYFRGVLKNQSQQTARTLSWRGLAPLLGVGRLASRAFAVHPRVRGSNPRGGRLFGRFESRNSQVKRRKKYFQFLAWERVLGPDRGVGVRCVGAHVRARVGGGRGHGMRPQGSTSTE